MVREEAKALTPKQCAVIELALDTIKVHILLASLQSDAGLGNVANYVIILFLVWVFSRYCTLYHPTGQKHTLAQCTSHIVYWARLQHTLQTLLRKNCKRLYCFIGIFSE